MAQPCFARLIAAFQKNHLIVSLAILAATNGIGAQAKDPKPGIPTATPSPTSTPSQAGPCQLNGDCVQTVNLEVQFLPVPGGPGMCPPDGETILRFSVSDPLGKVGECDPVVCDDLFSATIACGEVSPGGDCSKAQAIFVTLLAQRLNEAAEAALGPGQFCARVVFPKNLPFVQISATFAFACCLSSVEFGLPEGQAYPLIPPCKVANICNGIMGDEQNLYVSGFLLRKSEGECPPTPTATNTSQAPTATKTLVPPTATSTTSLIATNTPTATATPRESVSPSPTLTATQENGTPTETPTSEATEEPSATPTPDLSQTETATPTSTDVHGSPTPTATETPAEEASATPSSTPSSSPTLNGSESPTPTETSTQAPTSTAEATATPSPTSTADSTATATATSTPDLSASPSATPTFTETAGPTHTPTGVIEETPTETPAATHTPTAPLECDSGYYVLDSFGGRHRIGNPISIVGSLYFGYDIARDFERATCDLEGATNEDLVVLDGFGTAHFVQSPGCDIPQMFYFGDMAAVKTFPQGRAVDLLMSADHRGLWVLTDFGGIYRAGSTKDPLEDPLVPNTDRTGILGFDIPLVEDLRDPNLPSPGGATLRAVSFVVIDTDQDSRAEGYVVLNSMGGRVHLGPDGLEIPAGTYSGAPDDDPLKLLDPGAYVWPLFPGLDIARDIELHPTQKGVVILDGWDGIHPVPVDRMSNPVYFARNDTSLEDPTPVQMVGMPYVVTGYDDPATPEDEGNHDEFGIDAASIFRDLEFSAGCGDGLYTLEAFGGVFVMGSARPVEEEPVPQFGNSPYFFPYQYAESIEIFAHDEAEDSAP